MTSKRSYGQFCSLARALDVVGERWTLLLVRDMLEGPRRYKDLLAGLPGMGTNLLATRLKQLEDAGLIEQGVFAPITAKSYRLTARGRGLEPALAALASWGRDLLEQPRGADHWSPAWNGLALKARFLPERASGLYGSYAYVIDGFSHYALLRDGRLSTGLGLPPDPDFTLRTSEETFLSVFVTGGTQLDAALQSGAMVIEGSMAAFEQSLTLFGA